jgi:predicted ATPase
VLQDQRKVLHERTAQAIEGLYGSSLDDHYSELAYHYSRSANTQKAVEYLRLAGEQAVQRSAYAEAISHLTTALELLKPLPDTPERLQQELRLQTALGLPLMLIKGAAAPEVGAVYTRARELCRQVGETPQLFSVLRGLWRFHLIRAELRTARELGEQLHSRAQRGQDPTLLLEAYRLLGTTLYWLGEFAPAREALEQGVTLYDPGRHHSLAFIYGQDPGVACRTYTALALWHLGYPDQALRRSHEALRLAQELSHPYSLSWASVFAALFFLQLRREGQAVQERAEAVITVSTEQGFALESVAIAPILQGWALAEQGQGEKGIAGIRQGLDAMRAIGAELGRPYYLALLAAAYGKVGQAEEGLTALAEALTLVDQTGECFHEAELYRLKGTLTLKQFGVGSSEFGVANPQPLTLNPQAEAEAEACFLKAIDIARTQQAKSLELRATVSLARLWQSQGKHHAARNTLSAIYNWFTEGFDTKDLQEAKALLEELV